MNKQFFAFALVSLALAGCASTISKDINDNGVPKEVIFPKYEKSKATYEAISPNIENLHKIKSGVSKDDLYNLIGHPHFNEGFGAREWDYLFNFRTNSSSEATVCQYKIIFDKSMLARSFYWLPASCADHVK